jgi:hypothetical protein
VACSPAPAATIVEIPPAPLPQSPVEQIVARQAHFAPSSHCEAPRDLSSCTELARLRVGHVELSSPTCWVDAKVSEGESGRLLRCPSGTVVVFGRVSFAGPASSEMVETCLRTEFPFEDGCRWETLQRVSGAPDGLVYTYSEKPISGARCAPSWCRARANIEVQE